MFKEEKGLIYVALGAVSALATLIILGFALYEALKPMTAGHKTTAAKDNHTTQSGGQNEHSAGS